MTDAARPIAIAVVGHTNAGKTSLLRTLCRNKSFGAVSGRHGQTQHVEATSVSIDGRPYLKLFDTPGFEDSIALQAYLQQFAGHETRRAALSAFLASPEARGRFEQEAKILRLLLDDIDAVFYVIDTTETPHAKFRAELDVLAASTRPVMPVLNFVRHPESRIQQWQDVLADRGLHVQLAFDVVAPLAGSERALYAQLSALIGGHRERLSELAAALEREAAARRHAGLRTIGDLLIDVAAYRVLVSRDDEPALARHVADLQATIRAREQASTDALLALHRFDRDDLEALASPALRGRLNDDLFNPEVLKLAAQRLGKGAAIGAVLGLAADLAVAGISLGAGALIGGAVGGMLAGSWQKTVRWAGARIKGRIDLTIEDAALAVLLSRQSQLLLLLQGRAHAAIARLVLGDESDAAEAAGPLLSVLKTARAHPEWSRLGRDFRDDAARSAAIETMVEALAAQGAAASPPV